MGRVVVLVLLVMVVVVVLAVRSQSRSRCGAGGEPEQRTQGLCGRSSELLLERMRNAECALVVYSYENKWAYT